MDFQRRNASRRKLYRLLQTAVLGSIPVLWILVLLVATVVWVKFSGIPADRPNVRAEAPSSGATVAPGERSLAEVRSEPVRFQSDGIVLSGTLFFPEGNGPHPAIVLFHGSGVEGRNRFLGRWFAEHGLAALTYDKRGVGESTGDFRTVAFTDLCNDGLAAVRLLKSMGEIDTKRIGVWGLSQGGWLAPLAASRSDDIAFVIAVSGPGVSPGEQMLFYYASELRALDLPDKDVEQATALRREVWTYLNTGKGYERARRDLERGRRAPWYTAVKGQRDDLFGPLQTPTELRVPNPANRWFRHEMIYDPTIALQGLKVPSLFIFGEDDQLVPVPQSVNIIRSTLQKSGNRDFTIRVLPHTDHGMRIRGEAVPSGEYLDIMRIWLRAKLLRRH